MGNGIPDTSGDTSRRREPMVDAAGGGGAPRAILAMLGMVFLLAGAFGVYATRQFAKLTAWELPAWVLLAIAGSTCAIGLAIAAWALTARDRRKARTRLLKAVVGLTTTGVCVVAVNALLGRMVAEPPFDPRAIWPDYDPRPFETANPLCETTGAPDEARYAPNLTLRYCLPDFQMVSHTTADGTRAIGREPSKPLTLAIGDSFTYGYGVPDDKCFAARLGWINAGLWGRPPSMHIRALRWWAPRLKPKRVVWEIYLPHLITELPDGWMSRYQYPALVGTRWEGALNWYHETGIGQFLHHRFGLAINRADFYTKEAILFQPPGLVLNAVYDRMESHFREAWQLSRDMDFDLWVVLVPSKMGIARSLAKSPYADLPVSTLTARLRAAGVDSARIIDLTPHLKSRDALDELFFKRDAHWNERGHRTVADLLARLIAA